MHDLQDFIDAFLDLNRAAAMADPQSGASADGYDGVFAQEDGSSSEAFVQFNPAEWWGHKLGLIFIEVSHDESANREHGYAVENSVTVA